MCRTQVALVLVALYISLVHSWDIAVSLGDRLEFYANGIKSDTVHFKSYNLSVITYDEVHNMMLFVDKQRDYDAVCGYNLASMDIKCFIKRNGSNIDDIAFDPVEDLLFFTDTKEGSINWISLKDQGSENNDYGNLLIKMDDRTVTGIALDSCRRYIYWINTETVEYPHDYMERVRFNGSDREVVNQYLPIFTFAIDPQTFTNHFINGYTHEFHVKVDLRENYLNDEKVNITLYNRLISIPKELTISDDYIYWMNSSLSHTSIWQRPKTASNIIEPREICKFDSERPLGIAANYKIREQVQGLQDCEALSRLVPAVEVTNNFHNIEQTNQKQQTLETTTIKTEQTTGTEYTTDVKLTCVHGTKLKNTSVCKCTPGYTGERCDVFVCENYCLHGDCSFNDEGLPKCRCKDGYSGQRCEVNACLGFCLNGGVCSMNERSEPICQCNRNYVGDRCEVSGCFNYCFQGSCNFNDEGHPECRCNIGYSGDRCEVYACHGYCMNNGNCTLNEEDEPFCQCDQNHMGSRCEAQYINDSSF